MSHRIFTHFITRLCWILINIQCFSIINPIKAGRFFFVSSNVTTLITAGGVLIQLYNSNQRWISQKKIFSSSSFGWLKSFWSFPWVWALAGLVRRCQSPELHERSDEAQGMLGDGEMLREREPTLERTRSAGTIHASTASHRSFPPLELRQTLATGLKEYCRLLCG